LIIRKNDIQPSNQYTFDVKYLPNGIYYLTIKSNSKVSTIKIIKEQ